MPNNRIAPAHAARRHADDAAYPSTQWHGGGAATARDSSQPAARLSSTLITCRDCGYPAAPNDRYTSTVADLY